MCWRMMFIEGVVFMWGQGIPPKSLHLLIIFTVYQKWFEWINKRSLLKGGEEKNKGKVYYQRNNDSELTPSFSNNQTWNHLILK